MEESQERVRATVLSLMTALALLTSQAALAADSEVPEGTRFLVELRDKIEAKKVKRD